MRNKHLKYLESELFPHMQSLQHSNSQPIKSPSPDKKRANIITPTRSPQINEIKRNMTPNRMNERRFQPLHMQSKMQQQSTRYYTNQDFLQYRSSQKKQYQQIQNIISEQFNINNMSSSRQKQVSYHQLDYIKLLQQKQKTIKELHEIIEMINKNNSLEFTGSQIFGKTQMKDSQKSVMSYKTNDLVNQKQLKNQVRILTIENQQLLHLIEKSKTKQQQSQSQYGKQTIYNLGYNNTNYKEQNSASKYKEEILSRQVKQLQQSLLRKEQQQSRMYKQNQDLYKKHMQLDEQNKKLIKMMKEKDYSDTKYNQMIESNISHKSYENLRQQANKQRQKQKQKQKQKLTLLKIKQQYQQNLRMIKDNIQEQISSIMTEHQMKYKQLQNNFYKLQLTINMLEKFKYSYENLKLKQKLSINQHKSTSQYQQNDVLHAKIQQMSQKIYKLHQILKDKQLQIQKIQQILKQKQYQIQKLHQKLTKQSYQSQRNQQIEHMNIQIQQQQIIKLRQSLKRRQFETQKQKQSIMNQIQIIRRRNQQNQYIIDELRIQVEEKQFQIQSRTAQKQEQIKRASSVIDELKIIISEKQMAENDQNQMEHLKQRISRQHRQIEEKDNFIQQTTQRMQQKVKQLVQNYETQINILKNTVNSTSFNYKASIDQKTAQIANLLKQAQNTENILFSTQQLYKKQNNYLKSKIQQLQTMLSLKHKQSNELLHSKQQLQHQHQSLKQNLEQLLYLSKEVEDLQDKNKQLQNKNQSFQVFILELRETISTQSQSMDEQTHTIHKLRQRIHQMQQQLDKYNRLKIEFEQLEGKLQLVRQQSIDNLQQKDIQLMKEIGRFQQQKAEYENIISQLKNESKKKSEEVDQLREQHLKLQECFHELLVYRQTNLLPELYDLRQIILSNITKISTSSMIGDKDYQYDLGKVYIEYESKIEEVNLLHISINELKESCIKEKQQKFLLHEKITFLEKNVSIYEQELRQRKIFCERLISEKTKLEKELLLIKKVKFETKNQENTKIRESLLNRVNKLVQLEENRDKHITVILDRENSPIKLISAFESRVQNYHEFGLHHMNE